MTEEMPDSAGDLSADMEVHESDEEQFVFDDSVDTEEQTDSEAESTGFNDGQLVQITAATANMTNVRTDFYSGMERICLDGCSVDISYANGETENIVLNGYSEVEDSYGNMFGYKFGEQNGKYAYPMGSALSPGVYNLIFTVNDEKLDIGAAYTITAGFLDLNTLLSLSENEWRDVPELGVNYTNCSFTPTRTGLYTWETKDNSYGLNVEFYRQGKRKYECFDSGIVNLNAGETYLVRIRLSSYQNSKAQMPIKILPYSPSEYELTGDQELAVGMKKR